MVVQKKQEKKNRNVVKYKKARDDSFSKAFYKKKRHDSLVVLIHPWFETVNDPTQENPYSRKSQLK